MASLQELLAQEGFQRHQQRRQSRNRRRRQHGCYEEAAAPPVYLCRNRRNVGVLTGRPLSSERTTQWLWQEEEPGGAARAVVSTLSGYLERFSRDAAFRREIRERCSACLPAATEEEDVQVAMESVERIAAEEEEEEDDGGGGRVGEALRRLTLVASGQRRSSAAAACAQIYLAIIFQMKGDERAAARRLLRVFSDAPAIARKSLMPELWESFFLPHLLHLQNWFNRELELAAAAMEMEEEEEREERMRELERVYNDQIDVGTAQFATYYKDWLKNGMRAPSQLPTVALPPPELRAPPPPPPAPASPSSSSGAGHLYQTVFGHSIERDDSEEGLLASLATEDGASNHGNSLHSDMGVRQRRPHPSRENPAAPPPPPPAMAPPPPPPPRRSSYSLRFFTCRSDPKKGAILPSQVIRNGAAENLPSQDLSVPDLGRAIAMISTSENLSDGESAVRAIAAAWLGSGGTDPTIEAAVSAPPVIEGLLEVSFSSKNNEVLELALCLLAELAARKEVNRRVVLNADPQLEIFLRLMGIQSLFLKAAVLLYLLKPRAKQLLSSTWVPLVLQILELGDKKQTLFSVQCRAKSAALYLLDQLLRGFDVDRNVENAKQLVAQGGLRLLLRRLEVGDGRERKAAAALLAACVRADGSCRPYLAAHMKKASILELLLGNQLKSNGSAISLLVELMKLDRRTQITMFLNGLKNEGCLNTMHILFVYLQQAPADQRPLVAAILLQLDLLGDNFQHSVYREEGIDALVMALNCKSSKKVQENCAKALSILGGRFSGAGEALTEAEMLKRAGFDDNPGYSFGSKDVGAHEIKKPDEEEIASEDWQRSLAHVLLSRGSKRLLASLAHCIADGIPSLARSCLVTVAWMSSSLSSSPFSISLWSSACPLLLPQLVQSLNYDRAIEERVLASFSLLNLSRNPECRSMLMQLDEQSAASLNDLAWLTWTARELILMGATDSVSFLKI